MQWLLIYTNIFEQNQKCDSKNTKERELKLERRKTFMLNMCNQPLFYCMQLFPLRIHFFYHKKDDKKKTFLHPLTKSTVYGFSF